MQYTCGRPSTYGVLNFQSQTLNHANHESLDTCNSRHLKGCLVLHLKQNGGLVGIVNQKSSTTHKETLDHAKQLWLDKLFLSKLYTTLSLRDEILIISYIQKLFDFYMINIELTSLHEKWHCSHTIIVWKHLIVIGVAVEWNAH